MSVKSSRISVFVLILAGLALSVAGCGGDDDHHDILQPAPSSTVIIEVHPDNVAGPWRLIGPGGSTQMGEGNATLSDLKPGDYAVVWGAVGGWITPVAGALGVAADDTVTFMGTYAPFTVPAEMFVHVPAGTYQMGSPTDELGRAADERRHQVTLTHAFYAQITEVTNRQYADLAQWAYEEGYVAVSGVTLTDRVGGGSFYLKQLGSLEEIAFDRGAFSTSRPDDPVKYLNWYGAAAYCDWLNLQQGLPLSYNHRTWECNGGDPYNAEGYRLPTEAEWEYACRAGTTTALTSGPLVEFDCLPLDPNLDLVAWYCGNARASTNAVRTKAPNAWGLYDVHGNNWEWCNDWYGPYPTTAAADPVGPAQGTERVLRGGSWTYDALHCRVAYRGTRQPNWAYDDFGMRVVRTAR